MKASSLRKVALAATPLTWWRAPHFALVDIGAHRLRLEATLQRAKAPQLGTASLIRAVLHSLNRRRRNVPDLIASALFRRALAGDAAAQVVIDHARRRRGLQPINWARR